MAYNRNSDDVFGKDLPVYGAAKMTEQEHINKCWDEYTAQFDLFGNEWHDKGLDEIFKAGFLAAKRTMPVIELPDQDNYFDRYNENSCDYASSIKTAITAAGYQYKIKGE